MDRRIIKENMKLRGWNEFRLEKELSSRKIKLKDVFLLSVDDNGKIYIIRKDKNQ